jgi:hypothetical protein
MTVRYSNGLLHSVLANCLALQVAIACKGSHQESQPSPKTDANVPVAANTTATTENLGGIDPCLVGEWKSVTNEFHSKTMDTSGGANIVVRISADGSEVVNFDSMSPLHVKLPFAKMDVLLGGNIKAKVATPEAGKIVLKSVDYSEMRPARLANAPGGQMFKGKTLGDLSKIYGTSAPSFDMSGIVSATEYTCTPTTLTGLDSKNAGSWTLARNGR